MGRKSRTRSDVRHRLRTRSRALNAAIRRAFARAFPERQILIRELDRMSVYRLSRGTQAVTTGVAIIMSGATIAIVVAMIFPPPVSRPREVSAVIAAKLDPPSPAGEIAKDKPVEPVVAAIVAGPAPLAVTVEPPTVLPDGFLLHGEPFRSDAGDAPGIVYAVEGRLRAQLAAIDDRVFALATRGLGAPPAADDARASRLAEEDGDGGLDAHVASIERHVERLATGVSALRDAESSLVREVQPQLAYFIQTAERVIERAGLDLDDVFQGRDKAPRRAEGGPFVAAVSGPLAAQRAALHTDLAYWQALRELVGSMPLASPLDRYAVSSSFGTRTDPLNNRKARHNGLDLISAMGSAIRAPAPGVVTFAGRNGGYGNFIEIDHGKSLRTRYAHLRSIKVKKGQKVEFLEKIGQLGNSGRSTGAHLHYEVLVAGKPVNPMSFIKAGQHVFQE